jgi:hypothetical protein
MAVAGDTDVDSPDHRGCEEFTTAWAPGATSGPAGRRRGVLGGRDRLVGWDLGVAVSLGFPGLAVDEGGRAAVGAGR